MLINIGIGSKTITLSNLQMIPGYQAGSIAQFLECILSADAKLFGIERDAGQREGFVQGEAPKTATEKSARITLKRAEKGCNEFVLTIVRFLVFSASFFPSVVSTFADPQAYWILP